MDGPRMPTRVVVVDDHALFRNGLKAMLEEGGIRVVGEAPDGESALAVVRDQRPDVVVMDLNLPAMSGIEATRRVRELHPETAVLVLTVVADGHEVVDALIAGAVGYLLKDAPSETIVEAIHAAACGDSRVSPRVAGMLVERIRERGPDTPVEPVPELSARELEVLRLVVTGADNGEIAERLVISQNTVKHHVSSILKKLGVQNRIQAAVRALEAHLV